jgi:hypothetical protein
MPAAKFADAEPDDTHPDRRAVRRPSCDGYRTPSRSLVNPATTYHAPAAAKAASDALPALLQVARLRRPRRQIGHAAGRQRPIFNLQRDNSAMEDECSR